uniref:helix-turn-helix domain-containing protein n=1 Tax=Flavobacterium sp. TaxID=239 RepID=UPI00404A49F4
MTKQIVQIEVTTSEDFKNEIICELTKVLKDFVCNTQNNEEKLLTREKTAEMLSISLVTLWDWTKKDIIPAHRIGNLVRYKKEEVLSSLQKKNNFNK